MGNMEATPKRRKKPTIAETREEMARTGDVEGLWRVIVENNWTMVNQPECFDLLLRAVEVAARQDPTRFSRALLARMLSLTTYLVLRGHYYARTLLAQYDEAARPHGPLKLPRDVTDLIPRLIEL